MNQNAVKPIDSDVLRTPRGNVNNKKDKYNSDHWALEHRNERVMKATLRHADKRHDIFELLLTDSALRRMHDTAVDATEEPLRGLKDTSACADLVAELKEGFKIPIAEVVARPPKWRDPAKIMAMMLDVKKKRNTFPREERRHMAHRDWGA
jgi:hypothetical protein